MKTELYTTYQQQNPKTGQHILAHQTQDTLLVYQAFNNSIAEYALQHQTFGGSAYSFNRMSWIKPNFLWMMYRCGWATKENQERVLAIEIKKTDFDYILANAAYSSFKSAIYTDRQEWKTHIENTEIRLQWDPDHDPFGKSVERRAVQLGMKGDVLKSFCKEMILNITDVTPFVKEQNPTVSRNLETLIIPQERVYSPSIEKVKAFLELSLISH